MSAASPQAREAAARWRPLRLSGAASRYALPSVFMLLLVVLLITTPEFRNWNNIANILQQNAMIGIVACGMLVMIVTGGFDLSVGAVGAMTSVATAWLVGQTSPVIGIAGALLLAVVIGLVNGIAIAKIGINPFVATLGTQVLVTGILYVVTSAAPVYGLPPEFAVFGQSRVGGVPTVALIFLGVIVLTWAMLRFTRFGHYLYAVGGNRQAARLAGVNADRILLLAYTFGALCAGIAGLVLVTQTGIGQPNSATTWPLSAIAAVVVGGVPLAGGIGRVSSAVLGTLLLGVVANALNLLGVSSYWQPAVTGVVILVAVGIDSYQRKRASQT